MTTIRKMERRDFDQVSQGILRFGQQTNLRHHRNPNWKPEHFNKILLHCHLSGSCWVAAEEDLVKGFIISMRDRDLWLPDILYLKEVAWWVEPQYRGERLGGALIEHYCEDAEQLLNQGLIAGYTMTLLGTSPDIDYRSRGFRQLETTWIRGGI